jgi:hypothetical protein
MAGTLLDLDHLLLYGARTGDWSIPGALHYDRYRHRHPRPGDTRPRYGSLRSWLHQPLLVLPPLWALARRRAALRPLALGLSLHLLLDQYDLPVRVLVWARAGGRCEGCGRRGRRLSVHRSGRLGSYSYWVTCAPCDDALARRRRERRPSLAALPSHRNPERPVVH